MSRVSDAISEDITLGIVHDKSAHPRAMVSKGSAIAVMAGAIELLTVVHPLQDIRDTARGWGRGPPSSSYNTGQTGER